MNLKAFVFGISLLTATVACSATDPVTHAAVNSTNTQQPEERISLSINEVVYFEFFKYDTLWTGNLTVYTMNSEGEKVVQSEYVSAQDSSWNDFNNLVHFLDIYEIAPQNEIEDWVPDSSQLPKRVYNFEVFDGDTTRSFSYQDPINGIRDFWQAQSLLTFATFIQNDLKWVEKPD